MTDFNHVATHIIQESIANAIYIDDKVWLPYENQGAYHDHSELFKAFKESNCLLDINRYSKEDAVNYPGLLATKDLLILDWHLNDKDEDDLSATFDIIDRALEAHNLHFCIIYTKQKKADLAEKVIFNIASFYSGLHKELCDEVKNSFSDLLESDFGLEQQAIDRIYAEIISSAKQLFFEKNRENIKKILQELKRKISEIENALDLTTFLKRLNLPEKVYTKQLICLGFILDNLKVPQIADSITKKRIKTFDDRFSIQLNNLFIKTFDKDDMADNLLYGKFMDSLILESNIFLTLLGLEIRNRFRETSGFIGSELEGVDHLAFFHHRQNHFKDEASGGTNIELFNEFLKDIWKDQVSSFLLEKEIKLFGVIDDYKQKNNIDTHLMNFKHSNLHDQKAIAKLNWVYNRLAINRKDDDDIRFGDIFSFVTTRNAKTFILCITPICDCLRPKKIHNNFFFIEGTDIGVSKGVQKTDGDFVSFIMDGSDSPTCIDWTNNEADCKPFTLFIANNRMKGNEKMIEFNFRGEAIKASYVCTLKENYAQRIANRAFFYPLRVGIDFASFTSQSV